MQLFIHTPIWVWAILVFVLYKGLQQRKTRSIKLWQLFIFPAFFFPLTFISIHQNENPFFAYVHLAIGITLGLLFGFIQFRKKSIVYQEDKKWIQRGSMLPLSLYLFIFITRYVINTLTAMQQEIIQTNLFNLLFVALGIGLGGLLSIPMFKQKSAV